jgi:hypothetical protein
MGPLVAATTLQRRDGQSSPFYPCAILSYKRAKRSLGGSAIAECPESPIARDRHLDGCQGL